MVHDAEGASRFARSALALTAIVVAGCSTPGPAPPPPAPPVAELAPAQPAPAFASATATTAPKQVLSAVASTVANVPVPGGYRPAARGEIPCGATSCRAGAEACCGADMRGSGIDAPLPQCLPLANLPAASPMVVSHLGRLPAAAYAHCEPLTSFPVLAMCTHSGHCGGDDICVERDNPYSALKHCVAADLHAVEICSATTPCKDPGRHCIQGQCHKKDRSVDCDGLVCGPSEICYQRGGAPVCFGGELDGTQQIDPLSYRDCDGPEDCLSGQMCCTGTTDRCMYGCAAGDTPKAICADGRRCDGSSEDCTLCGAVAK
ncbi:MAG: hypothetical protein AAF715_13605 [Myxococcota bacterium]